MNKKSYSPSEIVPDSGIYERIAPNGCPTGQEVTCVEGEPFPPAPGSGYKYVLRRLTKHKVS